MAGQWQNVDIAAKLVTNVDETSLRRGAAAQENCFSNEAGGLTRFPGLAAFSTLSGGAPTYLFEWQQDLIAVSGSRVFRVDSRGTAQDVTGVPLSGNGRCVFTKTPDELVMAAGGPILRLAGATTELLSPDAPESTHVAFIDGFLLAVEANSGRFQHSGSDEFRTWDPLDVFSANAQADDINSMVITPYREVLLSGVDSIEQFERLTTGATPFFRRWAIGQGVKSAYTLLTADQGTWAVNKASEVIRIAGQTTEVISGDIGRTVERIDDWVSAWAALILIAGQKFVVFQMPMASNVYSTKGVTLLFDIRQKRWAHLYGWDALVGVPVRWPGWSYYRMWDRHFVGGDGAVLELTESTHANLGVAQRVLGRTAHIDKWGHSEITDVRIRLKRGVGSSNAAPTFSLRCKKDNTVWTRWNQKSLGLAGDKFLTLYFGPMGDAETWQFEWMVTDDCDVDVVAMQAEVRDAER